VTPQRLSELDPKVRRRALLLSALTIVVVWAILVAVYSVIPVNKETTAGALVRLVIGVVVVAVVLLHQTNRILKAELPELRAAEALALVFPIFILLFSLLYLSLSHSAPLTFNERLDHVRALYFTITVFSTVGFGDIAPRTDGARLICSVQMLLDLAFVGLVVRLLFNAARSGLGRSRDEANAPA
jgi:F0F1-type ATP synthase assembly protein I